MTSMKDETVFMIFSGAFGERICTNDS